MMALVLCVGFQGLALSVQRGGGRLHFHAPGAGAHIADEHGTVQAWTRHHNDAMHAHPTEGREPAPLFRHKQEHDHHHPVVADHNHEPGDLSVVAVGDDANAASHKPAPVPRLHDLDGLPHWHVVALSPPVRAEWFAVAGPVMRSHIASPPDRPPCA